VTLTAGARADLEVKVPGDGSAVRVQLSKSTAVIIGPAGADAPVPPQPAVELDLLAYGSPGPPRLRSGPPNAPVRISDRPPTRLRQRSARSVVVDQRPPLPARPQYVVRESDVVAMHIANHSGEVHPMHLHGHHVVVLARNGVASSGSRGGSTRSTCCPARLTTSHSWRTTPESGWTTATT
jgi:FtsP/CotA-like multicopper oxidase with cupredoxin domain